ncbi:MAG: DUF1266 domain-containing protein [Aestuariibaculum sp.]
MNSNIYFIIGGVAVVFIIYMVVLQKIMKKKQQSQLDYFNSNHSGTPLTEQQKRLLTFGAILFYHRNEKILEFIPKNRLDQYVYGLKQQWEITNSEEAKETLNNLIVLQRSNDFQPFLQQSSSELNKIQKKISKGLNVELSTVEQTNSAYAWDICRAVSLTKWCFWCGYLTEDETWNFIKQATDVATKNGKDWTDYTVSFLLGRTIQGFDLDDVIVESKQILHSQNPSIRKIEDIDVYKRYSFH